MGHARTGSSERDGAGLQIALSLSIFLAALNFFALSPFTPQIAADLHTSVPLVGQISTLMILTSAVFGLVIGPVSDHIGHRLPLLLGIVCVAANLVGLSLARTYPVMLALGLIGGLADALVFNIPFAIIGSRLRDRAQHQAISWTFASLSAAPILGVPILTLIGSQFGWRVALACAGGAAMVCAWFVAKAVPPDNQRSGEPLSLARIAGSYLPLFHDRTMVRLLASVGLRSMCWLGAIAYLGAFITDELHLGSRAGGLCLHGFRSG